MALTVKSMGKNHDWDFTVDEDGKITALAIKTEVNYGRISQSEGRNIWPDLSQSNKDKMQRTFDDAGEWFSSQFEWEE